MRKTALATSKTPVKKTAKTADHFGKTGHIDMLETKYGIAGIATRNYTVEDPFCTLFFAKTLFCTVSVPPKKQKRVTHGFQKTI